MDFVGRQWIDGANSQRTWQLVQSTARLEDSILEVVVHDVATRSLLLAFRKDHELLHNIRVVVVIIIHLGSYRFVTTLLCFFFVLAL